MIAESPGGSGVIGDTTMTCGILISGRSSLGLFERESPIHWSLYTQQSLWRLMTWVCCSFCFLRVLDWTREIIDPPRSCSSDESHTIFTRLLWMMSTSWRKFDSWEWTLLECQKWYWVVWIRVQEIEVSKTASKEEENWCWREALRQCECMCLCFVINPPFSSSALSNVQSVAILITHLMIKHTEIRNGLLNNFPRLSQLHALELFGSDFWIVINLNTLHTYWHHAYRKLMLSGFASLFSMPMEWQYSHVLSSILFIVWRFLCYYIELWQMYWRAEQLYNMCRNWGQPQPTENTVSASKNHLQWSYSLHCPWASLIQLRKKHL